MYISVEYDIWISLVSRIVTYKGIQDTAMNAPKLLNEEQLEALRLRLQEKLSTRLKPKRIAALRVNSGHRWQPPLYIEVGKTCKHLEKDAPPMLVQAVFEAVTFVVCTPERGVESGLPIFFAREDVREVIEQT